MTYDKKTQYFSKFERIFAISRLKSIFRILLMDAPIFIKKQYYFLFVLNEHKVYTFRIPRRYQDRFSLYLLFLN